MLGDELDSSPVDEVCDFSQHIYSFDQVDETAFSRIGGKAANLVHLRRNGLPVPSGYCIPIDVHQFYLDNGKLPDGLINEIAKIKNSLGAKVAIRSSANCEDAT